MSFRVESARVVLDTTSPTNQDTVIVRFSQNLSPRFPGEYLVESPIGKEVFKGPVTCTVPQKEVSITCDLNSGQTVKVTVTGVQSDQHPPEQLDQNANFAFATVPPPPDTPPPPTDVGAAINDIVGFPLLTSGGQQSATAAGAPGTGSLQSVIDRTLRELLGRSAKQSDPKSFVQALNQTFSVNIVEGHTEWTVNPRTFAGQSDLGGGVTGAQASLVVFANSALEQSTPLIETLYSLIPEADEQEVEAARLILLSEWTEFVEELATEGGPRAARADDLIARTQRFHLPNFGKLLGVLDNQGRITRENVVTIEEEQNLTSFITIRDYINSVGASWTNYSRDFFQEDLGTGLVLLSRRSSVVAESVNEVYAAMDSVFVGPAERLSARVKLSLTGFTHDMVVEEILTWVQSFAAEDAPMLIQEGGLRGIEAMLPSIDILRNVVRSLIGLIETQKAELPRGLQHPRVKNSLDELADYLDETSGVARKLLGIES